MSRVQKKVEDHQNKGNHFAIIISLKDHETSDNFKFKVNVNVYSNKNMQITTLRIKRLTI